jgi:hypothetical protein
MANRPLVSLGSVGEVTFSVTKNNLGFFVMSTPREMLAA